MGENGFIPLRNPPESCLMKPSGPIANLASWVTGFEGSNPSLSAIESFSVYKLAQGYPNARQ
jgi:hypothetical protein